MTATDKGPPGLGTAPTPERPATPADANGARPKESPCPPCEDGITLGAPVGRATERMLGLVGIFAGAVILVMGLDLFMGGALSAAVGIGRSDRDADAGA